MSINWGLIGQNNGGSFIDSFNRGLATAGALEQQQRQRAAAEQAQRSQAEARGMIAQGRDLDAARLLAGSGQAEEANALRAIFQQQTERAKDANGAMANIVNVVGRLPYEQRRDAIRQAAPFLMQMGIEPQQIAGFDPTDDNILALSRMFYTHEAEQDDIRQSFEANTGRVNAEAAQFNALHPQVDGTLLEYDQNGQNPQVVYRRERPFAVPVDSEMYREPGVMPQRSAPTNRLPVQGEVGGNAAFNTGRLPVGGMPQQPQQPQQFAQQPQAAPQGPQMAEGELYVPGGENWGRPEGQAQAAPTDEVQVGNLTVPAEWMPQDRPTGQQAQAPQQQAERQQVALPFANAGFGIGNRQQIQNTFYDEYRRNGATHEGALTMVAQIGRENGYDPTIIFGTHRDANPRAGTNVGAISWNRERYTRFVQAMTEQGFYRNGRLEASEESARAQARYSMQEMQARYPASYRVMTTEGLGYGEIEPTLSTNYYGWDRSGSAVLGPATARDHRNRMAGYHQTLSQGFSGGGGSEYQQASASTGGGQDPASQQGMGLELVRPARQRPPRPAAPQTQWRNATPEEVRQRGYAPGTVVQIGSNGQEQVRQQPPRGRAGQNQQGQEGRNAMVNDSMRRAVSTVQELLDHPGFSPAVGFPNPLRGNLGPMGMVPGSSAADFAARVETLKSQVFIPMIQTMRGMGALSNAEGERLVQSVGSLQLGQGEAQFRQQLNTILVDFSRYAPIPVQSVREARRLPAGTYVRVPNGAVRRVN